MLNEEDITWHNSRTGCHIITQFDKEEYLITMRDSNASIRTNEGQIRNKQKSEIVRCII